PSRHPRSDLPRHDARQHRRHHHRPALTAGQDNSARKGANMSNPRWLYRVGVLSCAAALTACSSGDDNAQSAGTSEPTSPVQSAPIPEPLVATYDGGLYVLDGETLELRQDIPLDGFLRVNPAGDDAHVL